jgi:hypothetical protein
LRYLREVFDLPSHLATLRDARQDPDIPPAAVFQAAFYGFLFRLPSFLQLQAELEADSHLRSWLGMERPFGDDVPRYGLVGFQLEPSVFALRHSKLCRLYHPTLLEIARQLYRSLYRSHPPIRAPTPPS